MKKLIFLLFVFFGTYNSNYAQSYLWAKSAGGSNFDEGISISTDASGNVFVTGNFDSPTITFGTTTLTNVNPIGHDIFIVKYDASGNVLWAKSAGGTDADYVNGMTTDVNGNVFVTGSFLSQNIAFGSITLTNTGSQNFFIAKYDASGNVIWAKSGTGIGTDGGLDISTDASGSVIATGYFEGSTITFGSITLTNTGLYSDDIFIVKYDASGNPLWAKSAGGTDYDQGRNISIDLDGNVFVSGIFKSNTISYGPTILTNANWGNTDIFVVKFDASGNILWAKSAGGTGNEKGYGISTDPNGNVFLRGSYYSSSITFGTFTLINPGTYDIFILKYDASGNALWLKSEGINYGGDICTDANGNLFVTGSFDSPTMVLGNTTLTNSGNLDMFIVKYDSSGNILWAKSAGGVNNEEGYSITTDASGNIIVTGYFSSPATTIGSITLTNADGSGYYSDMFIAKVTESPLTSITRGNNNSISTNIYPNPFISSATLKIEMLNPAKATVALADVTGKVVYYFGQGINLNAGENTFTYPENLSPGVYVVKVLTEDAVESLKCVKME
jgi:hypothetical protein